MKRQTAGRWDPRDPFCQFLAADGSRLRWAAPVHRHLLVAMDQLRADYDRGLLDEWLANDRRVLIDSGVFALAQAHARKHEIGLGEALALQPDQVDGWADLVDRYRATLAVYGDRAWGYIELDLGGRDTKRATRRDLEAAGLRPIPVYHPMSDGWDYLDELCQEYDRVAIGNFVAMEPTEKRATLVTLWERHRQYPDVWFHVLGWSANEWANGWPINSADASTWIQVVQWAKLIEHTDGRAVGRLGHGFQVLAGTDEFAADGGGKALGLAAYAVACQERNWRRHLADLQALGVEWTGSDLHCPIILP